MGKRLTIIELKGDPDELLEIKRSVTDPVMSRKGPEYGAISHVAAKAPDGLMIVNLWESEEDSERAFQDPEVQEMRNTLRERLGAEPPMGVHYEVVDHQQAP